MVLQLLSQTLPQDAGFCPGDIGGSGQHLPTIVGPASGMLAVIRDVRSLTHCQSRRVPKRIARVCDFVASSIETGPM